MLPIAASRQEALQGGVAHGLAQGQASSVLQTVVRAGNVSAREEEHHKTAGMR